MNDSIVTPSGISSTTPIAFIGGGNMARAIIGGLRRGGLAGDAILVVDPGDGQRRGLQDTFEVRTAAAVGPELSRAVVLVWAVKPQAFAEACVPCRPFVGAALQLSVMAGIRSDVIARMTGTEHVVRAMPNTPALIGHGIAGLFARSAVDRNERARAAQVLAATGRLIWFENEHDLDAVTALSGSGPAYVFYVIEAMIEAAEQMGLSAADARELALATLAGSTTLAQASTESPARLREQVTSKGGTTHAALASLETNGVKAAFVAAIQAARRRAEELGDEFSGA